MLVRWRSKQLKQTLKSLNCLEQHKFALLQHLLVRLDLRCASAHTDQKLVDIHLVRLGFAMKVVKGFIFQASDEKQAR